MSKNTGKPTQQAFEKRIALLGKRAYLHRFDDASAIRAVTGIVGYAKKQPADYLLTLDGVTRYVEVKSSADKTAFRFSQLEEGQRVAMRRVVSAGGPYQVVVHSLVLDKWFVLDGATMAAMSAASIPWALIPPLTEF